MKKETINSILIIQLNETNGGNIFLVRAIQKLRYKIRLNIKKVEAVARFSPKFIQAPLPVRQSYWSICAFSKFIQAQPFEFWCKLRESFHMEPWMTITDRLSLVDCGPALQRRWYDRKDFSRNDTRR